MTKKELIKRLEKFDDDNVIIISDNKGWSNIDKVEKLDSSIMLLIEKYPLFSNN